jgi:hypothetical protein
MTDRGRDTSAALTEVRTVLSRARTASTLLWRFGEGVDPDLMAMRSAMDQIAGLLKRWEKTGPAKCPECGHGPGGFHHFDNCVRPKR